MQWSGASWTVRLDSSLPYQDRIRKYGEGSLCWLGWLKLQALSNPPASVFLVLGTMGCQLAVQIFLLLFLMIYF